MTLPVLTHRAGAAALVLTLNAPDKRNALVPGTYEALHAGLDLAGASDVAAVILTGAAGYFCAGGDLDSLATRAALPLAEREERIEQLHRLVRRLRGFPKPVIAAIEGGAAGAGLSFALACDLVVAAEDARFTMAYVKAGLVPDGGASAALAHALPPQLAAEIALLGQPVSAGTLAAHGLVNRVVTPGTALAEAEALADQLAGGARAAQSTILGLLDHGRDAAFEDQLTAERRAMARALGGAEAAEGIAAFRGRRKPAFPAPAPEAPPQQGPQVRTAITDLFGTRLPIVAGGLMWLANADYVAACARAGIIGFLTAASHATLDDLRREIRRTRSLCGARPFGVNVSMLPKLVEGERTEAVFRVIAEEGVRFVETSGRSPEAYLPILREAGIKVIHKVASLRHAEKAQAIGVDAVSIVGAECGGHPGEEMIGSFVKAGMADARLQIPWLIGGGVGSGGQIAAILAMGGAGAVVGTRFLVAEEIPAHAAYKAALSVAGAEDTALGMHSVRNTVRALANDTMSDLAVLERSNPQGDIATLLPLVSGKIGRQAYETGDVSRGVLSAGQSLGMTGSTEPLAAIVTRMGQELEQALTRAATYTQTDRSLT